MSSSYDILEALPVPWGLSGASLARRGAAAAENLGPAGVGCRNEGRSRELDPKKKHLSPFLSRKENKFFVPREARWFQELEPQPQSWQAGVCSLSAGASWPFTDTLMSINWRVPVWLAFQETCLCSASLLFTAQ